MPNKPGVSGDLQSLYAAFIEMYRFHMANGEPKNDLIRWYNDWRNDFGELSVEIEKNGIGESSSGGLFSKQLFILLAVFFRFRELFRRYFVHTLTKDEVNGKVGLADLFEQFYALSKGPIYYKEALKSILKYYIPEGNSSEAEIGQDLFRRLEDYAKGFPEDLDFISRLHQSVLLITERHFKGEFYTPQPLAEKMVSYVYSPGKLVMDPACGTGVFLRSIYIRGLKKLFPPNSERKDAGRSSFVERLNILCERVYGIDINPFSAMLTRINLITLVLSYLTDTGYGRHIAEFWQSIKDANISVSENSGRNEPDTFNRLIDKISDRIIVANALDPQSISARIPPPECRFDIVLGNPPWIVINRIPSHKMKDEIISLGRKYGILRGGRFTSTSEITSIYIYSVMDRFLKINGILFFVVPASLATGDQHSLFRNFRGMKNIEFWDFDRDLFRIHALCFKAEKSADAMYIGDGKYSPIRWKYFRIIAENSMIPTIKVEGPVNETLYGPIFIEKDAATGSAGPDEGGMDNPEMADTTEKNSGRYRLVKDSYIIGRLRPIGERRQYPLLDFRGKSSYLREFRQGASLVPRNLLLVDVKRILRNGLVEIAPSKRIIPKKFSQWTFKPYDSSIVERRYVFKMIKSTGIIPFLALEFEYVFLPLEFSATNHSNTASDSETDGNISPGTSRNPVYPVIRPPEGPHAGKHFEKLSKLYTENMKKAAKIRTLTDRINYGNALLNPLQMARIKVVYNAIGTIVKSALIGPDARIDNIVEKGPIFVDTSLYYYVPENIDEAYYLLGFLNSRILTEHLRIIGSTGAHGSLRNIHKHPFRFELPKFNPDNPLHMKLSMTAKLIESYVKKYVYGLIDEDPGISSHIKSIQKKILEDNEYRKKLRELDGLVLSLFIERRME